MKRQQRGHFDLAFLAPIVAVVGLALTAGGMWLLWLAWGMAR